MTLKECLFYKNQNNTKKPLREQSYNYDDVKNEIDPLTIILKDIVCIDIDDIYARKLIAEANESGFFKNLVYEFKPEKDSYHFFFKKSKKSANLKNKNHYQSVANFEYEVLDKEVSVNFTSQWVNFDKPLPELSILFYPAYNQGKNWTLFTTIKETLENTKNANEGEGRSKNMFSLTANLVKNARKNKFSFDESDFLTLYHFYNEFIFNDPLNDREVNNNIKQILVNNESIKNVSEYQSALTENDDKLVFDIVEFSKVFVKKYNIINYNSQIYVYYDNKFLEYDKEWNNHANLIYYLIDSAFIDINNNLGYKFLKLSTNNYNEIINQIKFNAMSYNNNDTNPNQLRVKNGVIDWDEENKCFKHIFGNVGYQYKIFTDIDISYNENIKENQKIDTWLKELFYRGDSEANIIERDNLISVFWEMLGTTLMDNNNNRSAFLFKGYRGKNGKSTMLQFIARFLGNKNVASLKYEQLAESNFALSNLRNKKVNLTDEMPSSFDANNGTIKSLISGGTISTDIKFQPIAQWKNFATLIFASNYNIRVIKFNQAISDRLVILELKNRFDGKNEIKNKEQELLSDIVDYQYTLNKALEGLTRLINNNYIFTKTLDNFNNRLEMILDNEPVKKWLLDNNFLEDIEMNKNEDFIINNRFKEYVKQFSLKELLENFKGWFKDNYDKDSSFGLIGFKDKLKELHNFSIERKDGKEYLKYE